MPNVNRQRRLVAKTLALAPAWAASRAAAAQRPVLAVADTPLAAAALLAEAEGLFSAEGLALEVRHFPIGRVCLQHLLAGRAQFATAADTPIMLAAFTRQDFGIVATIATSGAEYRMVVRRDRGIGQPADLVGRRIGMLVGSDAHYFAESFLLFHGVPTAGVTWVPLEPGDAPGPLVRGEIDAAALFHPHVGVALHALGPRALALPTPAFFSVTFNLVSASAAAGGSDADLERLLRALRRATALLRDQPARAQAILARVLKLPPAELAATFKSFDFQVELAPSLLTTLEAQSRWAQRQQLVPAGAVAPDLLNLLRPGPLQTVDPRAVRVRV